MDTSKRINSERPLRWPSAWTIGGSAVAVVVSLIALRMMGRSWWCSCGQPDLGAWHIWSRHTSQHVIDPYTFTHVLHGVMFYGLARLILKRSPVGLRFVVAIVGEAAWEIAENTNAVIERYREATISLDYFGDSVINSMADVFACGAGFALAAILPAWISVAGFAATEVILLICIRDSLTLNILMLSYPIEAIKEWQMPPGLRE